MALSPSIPTPEDDTVSHGIERVALAPGLEISRVVTGLWQIADMERDDRAIDQNKTAQAMAPYVDAGYTTFDMADHYGSAEEIVGRFTRQLGGRAGVQALTKWVPVPGPISRDDVAAAVERSRARLQADVIDLLQFHAWNYADPSWLDGLFRLQELKSEGLIRHLGTTNIDTAHLRMAIKSGIELVSNQVCFSLIDRRPLGGMTELCGEHNIKLLAYGSVAGGFLTERWLGKPEPDWDDLETWSEMKYGRFIRAAGGWKPFQNLLRAVKTVAERHDVSMANVACRYVLDQPSVGGIIIGARLGLHEHIDDNLRLFQFALEDRDRADLDAALSGLDDIPGGPGDEYRREPFLTASGDLSHHLDRFPPPYASESRPDGRHIVFSGTPWEEMAGYCRAVRHGRNIWVSGTTATHRQAVIGGSDAAAQTHFVIDKIDGALQSLGSRLHDVVRTRVFVSDASHWEAVARAHGERFREILPANTLVQAHLIGDEYLVEMEAEAIAHDP